MKGSLFTKLLIFSAIAASAAIPVDAQTSPRPKAQRVYVKVTENGYRPSSFRLRRGVRAYITFTREADAVCGEVIVMPKYGIHRTLPPDQPVTVTFLPRDTGTLNFTCGMNMLRGRMIVN
jgi:plastocyanin domain-containing protein